MMLACTQREPVRCFLMETVKPRGELCGFWPSDWRPSVTAPVADPSFADWNGLQVNHQLATNSERRKAFPGHMLQPAACCLKSVSVSECLGLTWVAAVADAFASALIWP